MNVKRILGLVVMLIGFLIPLQYAFLDIDDMNNVIGLIGFVGFLALIFVGYILIDSSFPQPGEADH